MGPKYKLYEEELKYVPLTRNLLTEEISPNLIIQPDPEENTTATTETTETVETSSSSVFPGYYSLFIFSQVGGFAYLTKTLFSCFFSLFYAFGFKLEIINNFSNLKSKYDSANSSKVKKSKSAVHTKSFHSKAGKLLQLNFRPHEQVRRRRKSLHFCILCRDQSGQVWVGHRLL